jgi:hypothetical protein
MFNTLHLYSQNDNKLNFKLMQTIYQGETFTNNTGRRVYYKLTYLNCFDMKQEETNFLDNGQTLQLFNSGSKATIYYS